MMLNKMMMDGNGDDDDGNDVMVSIYWALTAQQ